MSEPTKSCNLTESEIKNLIKTYGYNGMDDLDITMERLNYLHKRLKAFREPEIVREQPIPVGAWSTNG